MRVSDSTHLAFLSYITAEQTKNHLDQSVSMPRSKPWKRLAPVLLVALASLTAACDRRPPPPRARSIAPLIAEKMPILRPPQQNQSDDRRRFKDAPVYLDGRRVGVIRPLEVPSSLKPRLRIQPGGLPPAPRYSIAEYIAAVGGDLAKIREIHLYGGRDRISVISGDELRKHREDLLFLFTAGTRGKPRIGWPPTGIESTGHIDLVQAAVAYQDKDPPQYDAKKRFVHFGDGKPIEGIPYAPAEEFKGTRFYADGVLTGWMKRKVLPNSVIVPGADVASGLFSLRAYIETLGVDPRKVKAIELVQDDQAVARLDGRVLGSDPPLAFRLPRRNQGNLVLLLPPSLFPSPPPGAKEPAPVRISAVQLFLAQAPPARTYARAEDVIEPPGDQDRPRGPGSGGDQGDSEN